MKKLNERTAHRQQVRKRLILIIIMVSQEQTLANVHTALATGAQGREPWERVTEGPCGLGTKEGFGAGPGSVSWQAIEHR